MSSIAPCATTARSTARSRSSASALAASAALLARFDAERADPGRRSTIPGIARLFDAGTSPDGSPYLVLELVDGEPIDRWCAERGTGLRDRLGLVIEVCEAVAFAHQRLVLHRDLKPSNILVTRAGDPKLLDFGIAKLLDPADRRRARRRP